MKFTLLAVLALAACAPSFQSYPVTGAIGRVIEVTTVACIDLSPTDCSHTRTAVEYINTMFGRELLRFTENSIAALVVKPGHPMDPDAFTGTTYARTNAAIFWDSGIFAKHEIVVFWPEDDMSPASRQTMFRHELCHAIGLSHSPWDRTSLMFPAGPLDMAEPEVLNGADLRMLHAIYGE